jgi:hydrogenase expression/formation protein HypE
MSDEAVVTLAHGGGGRAMQRLIEEQLLPAFANAALLSRHDGAVLGLQGPCAFTTDSYVVSPLEFPGGDIGTLAINGTVNDLAMCGAMPEYLSLGLIIEEGLPITQLQRIIASLRTAAIAAGVSIVTGDTKVVEHGKADRLFINTSGVGRVIAPAPPAPRRVQPGDVLIVSGDLGRHGLAVLDARSGLHFEPPIASDCAPLWEPVLALFAAGLDVHCLRDLTRGGLASALVEIAEACGHEFVVDEAAVPVSRPVAAACELLGLDVLHVANEGRFLAIVGADAAEAAIATLRSFPVSGGAVRIGTVTGGRGNEGGRVTLRTAVGTSRALDMLSGEQLPRIC